MRKIHLQTAALVCAIGATSARGADGGDVSRPAESLYGELCAGCHGGHLEGGKAGSLLDPVWRHGSDDASLARIIRDGVPDSGMPSFGAALNDGEVRALVVLIRESAAHAGDVSLLKNRPLPAGPQVSERERYRVELVAEGFDVPWAFAFLPDGRLLVTERPGRLRIVERGGRIVPEPVAGVPPVVVGDEAGLFDVAIDPDYASDGWVYLSFADPGPDSTSMTKVVRGRLRDGRLVDQQTLFATSPARYTDPRVAYGGRLLFDRDHLFVSVGERGDVGAAQDLALPNGKVHRLFRDGRVPPDNPFAHTPGALASIWSFGHRNPQGLALDPAGGAVWETEHGPRGGDELNCLQPGHNYGWPLVTHGMNYNGTPVSARTEAPGLEQPARYWTPSIAVCPVAFYTGDRLPRWRGSLFLGSLGKERLLRFEVSGSKIAHEELLLQGLGRIRDIDTGPDGALYLSLEAPGRIVRLRPAD